MVCTCGRSTVRAQRWPLLDGEPPVFTLRLRRLTAPSLVRGGDRPGVP